LFPFFPFLEINVLQQMTFSLIFIEIDKQEISVKTILRNSTRLIKINQELGMGI